MHPRLRGVALRFFSSLHPEAATDADRSCRWKPVAPAPTVCSTCRPGRRREPALIADRFPVRHARRCAVLQHSGCVNAGLGGEGALTRHRAHDVLGAVEQFRRRRGSPWSKRRVFAGDADLEFLRKTPASASSVGMSDTEISVAAAFAEPVERALDLPCAPARTAASELATAFSAVVRVNADMVAGDALDHFADDSSISCGNVPRWCRTARPSARRPCQAASAQASA